MTDVWECMRCGGHAGHGVGRGDGPLREHIDPMVCIAMLRKDRDIARRDHDSMLHLLGRMHVLTKEAAAWSEPAHRLLMQREMRRLPDPIRVGDLGLTLEELAAITARAEGEKRDE